MNIETAQHTYNATRPLAGRISLVTGSTSGIGLGIAAVLAAAGSAVVLNGLGREDEITATRARLAAQHQVDVDFSPADMTKPAAIAEMIVRVLERHGRLDILVNNAGIQHVAPIDEFPVYKWEAILAIVLASAFHTTRLARHTRAQRRRQRDHSL
jgi:3-hydroxybutyrate dehydrogenase